jgi:hypothetical protein
MFGRLFLRGVATERHHCSTVPLNRPFNAVVAMKMDFEAVRAS